MMIIKATIALIALVFLSGVHGAGYTTPKPSGSYVFLETFDDGFSGWTKPKDEKYKGEWAVEGPESTVVGTPGDQGLVVKTQAAHHGLVAAFPQIVNNKDKDLVLQYEVRLQHSLECGGAYLKFLTADSSSKLENFNADTPYTVMFGPDKCGAESKVHFIVRIQNPITKIFEEHYIYNDRPPIKTDSLSHLYTAHICKNNTVNIYIDQVLVRSTDLLQDFKPNISPKKLIDDTTDSKPADWVDQRFILDPEQVKPDDWDESEPRLIPEEGAVKPADWLENEQINIPDPSAVKPSDWVDEEDGYYAPPMIPNPKCVSGNCGKWIHPMIDNPRYKGKWTADRIPNPAWIGNWAPRQIPNPDYYENLHPHNLDSMSGVGIEIWTMNNAIMFDNILVTYEKEVADEFASKTWLPKYTEEKAQQDEIDRIAREQYERDNAKGFLETVELYFNIVLEYCQENVLLIAGSFAVILLPLVVCCVVAGKSAPAKPVRQAPAHQPARVVRVEEEDEDEDEHEEEIVVDSNGKVKEVIDNRKVTKKQDDVKEKVKEVKKEVNKEVKKEVKKEKSDEDGAKHAAKDVAKDAGVKEKAGVTTRKTRSQKAE